MVYSWKRSCLGNSELKKMVFMAIPEDEISEGTKTERKKCMNSQNIVLLDGRYLLFEEYLQEKTVATLQKNRPNV